MREANTIKNHISHIIGQKAYDYLKGAADHLNAGERNGDFFHGLSGVIYGFICSLHTMMALHIFLILKVNSMLKHYQVVMVYGM